MAASLKNPIAQNRVPKHNDKNIHSSSINIIQNYDCGNTYNCNGIHNCSMTNNINIYKFSTVALTSFSTGAILTFVSTIPYNSLLNNNIIHNNNFHR
jgi:hypothetical protein